MFLSKFPSPVRIEAYVTWYARIHLDHHKENYSVWRCNDNLCQFVNVVFAARYVVSSTFVLIFEKRFFREIFWIKVVSLTW